jgi:glutaredoxin
MEQTMLNWKKVEGKHYADIKLFALSTCGWCRQTKKFLESIGAEYAYIDTDKLDDEEYKAVKEEFSKWNPKCNYPTVVINDKDCVIGADEKRIKELIGL